MTSNTASQENQHVATEELVEKYFKEIDARLVQFLVEPTCNDFWKAPPSAHPDDASFINNLKIPELYGKPVLLLHDIGNGVVDQTIVDRLFTEKSRFLVNTSGSGKTRLLFEGLNNRWGFFFTFAADPSNYRLGSRDILEAIDRHIPHSRSFTSKPETLGYGRRDHAYHVNHSIAKRCVHQVLAARILIFEHFLEMAQATCPTRPINEFKKHWLFLQMRSVEILWTDGFAHLSRMLKDASDEYLMMGDLKIHEKLVALQTKFGLDKDFFLVFDDAQVSIRTLNGCFRSEADKSSKWPVLRPIVSTWVSASLFPVIVSGSGLSIDIVNDIQGGGAPIGKPQVFTYATETGAFDECERQREYIMRYMPGHFAESESGKEFFRRAWKFARGRHRFTASLLAQLIKSSFQSPHRVLNAYVKAICGFTPSDGQGFVEKEDGIGGWPNISTFNFYRIRNDPDRIEFFCGLLYTWLMERKLVPLTNKDLDLVQQEFARFIGSSGENVMVDEPLVLHASTHHLRGVIRSSLGAHIKKGLVQEVDTGEYFERFVAYCLACAFDEEEYLCNILHFGENFPRWAIGRLELVSVVWKDGKAETNPFHLPEASTAIGFKCQSVEETEEWFRNPSSLMCFPDKLMGPDIVLFVRLLSTDYIMPVVVYCKLYSVDISKPGERDDAVSRLDHLQFFEHGHLNEGRREAAKELVLDRLRRLNGPDFSNESIVLKIIASYPAASRQDPTSCHGSLSMDECGELGEGDERVFLEIMESSLD